MNTSVFSRPRTGNKGVRRYHGGVWMPDNMPAMVDDFITSCDLRQSPLLSKHAASEMLDEQHGLIPMPCWEDLLNGDASLVECEEVLDSSGDATGTLSKMVLRLHHLSDALDFTYVVGRGGTIISAWANYKSDHHRLVNSIGCYYQGDG